MTRNNCLKEYKGTWGAGEDLLRIFLLSFLALISDKIQGWEGGLQGISQMFRVNLMLTFRLWGGLCLVFIPIVYFYLDIIFPVHIWAIQEVPWKAWYFIQTSTKETICWCENFLSNIDRGKPMKQGLLNSFYKTCMELFRFSSQGTSFTRMLLWPTNFTRLIYSTGQQERKYILFTRKGNFVIMCPFSNTIASCC